jgi:hypothetical protein
VNIYRKRLLENLQNFEETKPRDEKMALKRKFGTETSSRPIKKAAKTKERSRKESKAVSATFTSPEDTKEDLVSDDDEFRDSDMDQNESLSTDDEQDSDTDTDELDNHSEASESHSPNTSKTNGLSTGTTSPYSLTS